jgi:CRISPR/Cas system-associated exonuclease Cas4 (RecB family)
VAFGDPRSFVPLETRGSPFAEVVREGQARFVEAVQGIERGSFPVRPAEPFRCNYCAYPTVCRKDYVGDE